jgi:hypothetical protein
MVDDTANPQLQRLQKSDWRALPGLIRKREEIQFKARAKIAKGLVEKVSNLKDAPYSKNWDILNPFVHWTSARLNNLDEEVATVFYLRSVCTAMGFLLDAMAIGYTVHGSNPPPKIFLMVKEIPYLST